LEIVDMTENPLRKTVNIWVVIALAAAAMIFAPYALGIEGMSGGYAISFVSFFGLIVSIVVVIIYNGLALRLDKILSGENLLAHWTYTPEFWKDYADKEYETQKAESRGLFIIVSAFALFFGVLFWIIDPEAGFYVFLTMLGLIAIIELVRLLSAYSYKRNAKNPSEVYISKNGVYLNRQLHTWNFLTSRLEKVDLKDNKGLQLLSITYWAWTMTLGQEYNVRIPVPPGQEDKARDIVNQLKRDSAENPERRE
jgi:hypothetical protein